MRFIRDFLNNQDINSRTTLFQFLLVTPIVLLIVCILLFNYVAYQTKPNDKELSQNTEVGETNTLTEHLVKEEITDFDQPVGFGKYLPYDPAADISDDIETKSSGVGGIDFSDVEVRQGPTVMPNNLIKNYNEEVAKQYMDTVQKKEEKVYTCSISWHNRLDEYQFDTLSALAGQIYQDSINTAGNELVIETRRATMQELEDAAVPYNFYIDENGSLVIFTVVITKDPINKEQISELKTFTLSYEGNSLKIDGIN